MKIAIVDDNVEVLEILSEMMGMINSDLDIKHFEKANDCLKYLNETEVDILITDFNLSAKDMRGEDFIKKVAEDNMVRNIHIVSGDINNINIKDFSNNTPIDLHEKPIIDVSEFISEITVEFSYKEAA